ncbi:class I SAM-dependent methyltransferase [Agarivorans aestuarii]|uniref:Class I SAM-dependent methyltransferase n=1 Tax=Agarivorans aestuarii TaxID=1563703 RepID=A0ABU7G0J4_9ALTE|nr:class I SAM-dependent methyltransferase [Agarivorans aestuarii]MEE1672856.1 class I SAM-dependent methyltransferase [Agarivorans aestuarii]
MADGLRRAKTDADIGQWAGQRMRLIYANNIDILAQQNLQADLVYLDPMYPHRKK